MDLFVVAALALGAVSAGVLTLGYCLWCSIEPAPER